MTEETKTDMQPPINGDAVAMSQGEKNAGLATWCDELAAAAASAIAWTDRNGDLVRNEKESLQKELRRAGRLFKSCSKAARRKMCAGVFGPSQAGKSYLISALARGASSQLNAVFENRTHDFLSEINPEGGKESTGLVTRFTLSRPETPKGYPVQVALLSETDLVKIIANTYFADCEHKDNPQSDIAATLQKLAERQSAASGRATLDDMEDLREYLLNDFRSKARIQELERTYWEAAFSLAPKLDLEGRISLYALIWDEVEELTGLLRKLLRALETLNHAEILYCSFDALAPREKSIIDVATLGALESTENEDAIDVKTPDGMTARLPRSVITALTAELSISMAEKPAEYFDHTDLLDFPGYRSRYKLDNLRRELKKEGMLKELFLRGKVAYLFQRYCARHELNSMLLCIGPSNQEVQDLPGVINAWVASTHGATPEDRAGKRTSLFFILTKFDMEFEDKRGAPSVESRWDNRLHASLLDFFGKQHDWPAHWTPDSGFRNIFLLRNPNFRFEAIMDFSGDMETGIRPNRLDYVNRLKNAFLDSKLVACHFSNPELAWNEAMKLNDGGITLIRQSLGPLCDPAIKREQLLQNINVCRDTLARRLGGFHHADDREELRTQKTRLILSLFKSLGKLEHQRQRLGQLLRCFTMDDTDIYNLYPAAQRRFRELGREEEEKTQPADTGEELDLSQLDLAAFNPFEENASTDAAEQEPAQDEAGAYAALIESKWVEKMHAAADDPALQAYYMLSPREFSSLAAELATGAERLGFRKAMTDSFHEVAAYANTGQNTIARRQAAIAGRMINSYIDWLGHNPRKQTDAERAVHLPGGKTPIVFSPRPPVSGLPCLPDQRGQYSQKWFQDWLNAMAALILDNVNFDGRQVFNAAENAALGAILNTFNKTAYQ